MPPVPPVPRWGGSGASFQRVAASLAITFSLAVAVISSIWFIAARGAMSSEVGAAAIPVQCLPPCFNRPLVRNPAQTGPCAAGDPLVYGACTGQAPFCDSCCNGCSVTVSYWGPSNPQGTIVCYNPSISATTCGQFGFLQTCLDCTPTAGGGCLCPTPGAITPTSPCNVVLPANTYYTLCFVAPAEAYEGVLHACSRPCRFDPRG